MGGSERERSLFCSDTSFWSHSRAPTVHMSLCRRRVTNDCVVRLYQSLYNKEDIKIGVFTIYCVFCETKSIAINKAHNFVRSLCLLTVESIYGSGVILHTQTITDNG